MRFCLEREIVKENPKAKIPDRLKPLAPELVELHCSISLEVESLIRKVQNLESKRQKKNCSLEEALKEMARLYLGKNDPEQKTQRQKPRLAEKPNLPVLRRLPNQVRHRIALRDRSQCVFIEENGHRCSESRFTEIHHIKPYSIGGGHEPENLATLCSTHHKAIHEGVSGFQLRIG